MQSAIAAYFDADRRGDVEALTEVFALEAAVVDEGRTYVGGEAIGAWWSETKARYQTVLQPLEVREGAEATVVRARVSGNFPGSPATLTFAFQLDANRIKALEIGA
ncbi:nuclear transport factor 2 family protein [Phenylobacterium sp.]|jgi:hypothetical protein|uniref:nuclear transport factor 2 family protein n=1 Tax=Phenylobacterium sp. TaxID=1871053 RepID=UPI002E37DDE8|nr:nuclear transport factor 2 family protein [Phenylobacterium sp.]HEX2558534.1 nuclear transport factor 2 family protein [Phenylobacterium sp.]